MAYDALGCSRKVKVGLVRSGMVKDCQGWSKTVKDGKGWSRMVQDGKDANQFSWMFNDGTVRVKGQGKKCSLIGKDGLVQLRMVKGGLGRSGMVKDGQRY